MQLSHRVSLQVVIRLEGGPCDVTMLRPNLALVPSRHGSMYLIQLAHTLPFNVFVVARFLYPDFRGGYDFGVFRVVASRSASRVQDGLPGVESCNK